ncbi:MAG: hypothetical protein FK733_04755 [Asgard group archaeon]|nr:hypothetical protein [Asgard group archaeon]
MNESTPSVTSNSDLICVKEYRWSTYSFIIDLISFTSLTALIVLLMVMHRDLDAAVTYDNWVIIIVGVIIEILGILFSMFDSYRKNPMDKIIGARLFNLPVLAITVIITIIIFWGRTDTFAIVYGGICGGFAGYLAGGLAYPNFFIKIKDEVFRTIFGGWIGVIIGAIMGSVFAYLIDPFEGQVFGGIFMGFWGGAIVSGPIATVLLYLLRNKKKFTSFFTRMLAFGTIKSVSTDLNLYMNAAENKSLKLTQCKIFEEIDDKKPEPDAPIWVHSLNIIFATIILLLVTLVILGILSRIGEVSIVMFENTPKLEIASIVVGGVLIIATIIGIGLFGARSPDDWWQESEITKKEKILRIYMYVLFLYNPWQIDEDQKRREAFTKVFEFAVEKQGYTLEENIISL